MNWQLVIHALNEEAITISKRLERYIVNEGKFVDYSVVGQQRTIELTKMQLYAGLAKCLQAGLEAHPVGDKSKLSQETIY